MSSVMSSLGIKLSHRYDVVLFRTRFAIVDFCIVMHLFHSLNCFYSALVTETGLKLPFAYHTGVLQANGFLQRLHQESDDTCMIKQGWINDDPQKCGPIVLYPTFQSLNKCL